MKLPAFFRPGSTPSTVGASLLAIAVIQSTILLNVNPLSPSGWLPQEISVCLDTRDASAQATRPCLPTAD
jgi:hypothetical protein